MLIMKFGGSTIMNMDAIRNMIQIVRDNIKKQPVLVVSAIGKTTRKLLEAVQLASEGQLDESKKKLRAIQDFHLNLVRDLVPENNDDVIENLDIYFDAMDKLLEGVSVLRELSPRTQDHFLAYGELISSRIVVSAFADQKITAGWTDARQMIITNDFFTEAEILLEESFTRIQSVINPLLQSGKIPVVQGFIGSTENGYTTTLGFEGSDLTASILGAALKAEHIEIWKNVPGIMTADPAVCRSAMTLETLSYNEVAELTFFGAKVLHSQAIYPALRMNIPLSICDFTNKAGQGTRIVMEAENTGVSVRSIASKKQMSLICLSPLVKEDTVSFMQKVAEVFQRTRAKLYILQTAGNALSVIVDNNYNVDALSSHLKSFSSININRNLGTVSIIGENIGSETELPFQIACALKNFPIELISFGTSSCSITLLVQEDLVDQIVNLLHHYFFKTEN